jgi:3D-(3,5/4)-trihydroxycyclohexane-1,2-dione acylhydrolase (decyclizing)
VTLALPQDVQAELFDCPAAFFEPRSHRLRRPGPDPAALDEAAAALRRARRPLIVAGGGVKYSLAEGALADFATAHGVPVAETQAGKGSLAWDHAMNAGAIGVTGSSAANALAREADLVLAVGTRLGDFATGSRALFANSKMTLVGLNVAAFDAVKHGGLALVADARRGLKHLDMALQGWRAPEPWTGKAKRLTAAWTKSVDRAVQAPRRGSNALPSDAQVLGAVNRAAGRDGLMVCAAGGLPGELHKLWRAEDSAGYHVEYGYSCMGYEIAGGLGAKIAAPEREVFVLVGDGSYLMMNSEIATSIALDRKLILVVLDNRGFGCIHRLQTLGCKLEPFNNLLLENAPTIDFAAHAKSLGAEAEKVADVAALEQALKRARASRRTYAIVIDTDPQRGTAEGGAWWDVPVSGPAKAAYDKARAGQRLA